MVGLFPFALRNLARRRLRSLVTAVGVAVAVAALFSLVSFQRGYQVGLNGELDRLGAHLLVVPKGCPYDAASIALHGASWPCYLEQAYLKTVRATAHVAVAAPVFMAAVHSGKAGTQTVYCGVEPDILQVKRAWRMSAGTFPAAPGDLLVGADKAREHGWHVGETVPLPGLAGKTGRVSGILAPTQGADDLFVFPRLADAQRLFGRPKQLTHLLVRLDDPSSMDAAVAALRGCGAGLEMNIVPLAHLFHTIQNLVQSTRVLLGAVALVALLAAGAGVSNTVLMAVSERTREIGVLRAVGAGANGVWTLIWLETIALCALGGMAGLIGATIFARGVEAWLRARLPFAPDGALTRLRRDKIGFVFQHFGLLPTLSVAENVALPALFSRRNVQARGDELLARVGLAHRRGHRPGELSGGEMQRVAIARALIHDPPLLLADEPTGNLDSATSETILDLLRELQQGGLTVVVVTHNDTLARAAGRRIRLRDGQIVEDAERDG